MPVSFNLPSGHTVTIDEADADQVLPLTWHLHRSRGREYAAHKNRDDKRLFLHHFLLGKKTRIDHRDGNSLNNCRGNLRVATHAQNMRNRAKRMQGTSRFKGVYRARGTAYRAAMTVDKKTVHLGTYRDEVLAAKAYDEAARKAWGEFAAVNFPMGSEVCCLV